MKTTIIQLVRIYIRLGYWDPCSMSATTCLVTYLGPLGAQSLILVDDILDPMQKKKKKKKIIRRIILNTILD
jgi:hypothetical protein